MNVNKEISYLVAGGLAGMSMWTAVMPIDFIKTRIQTDLSSSKSNIINVLKNLNKNQLRPATFYAGSVPVLVRAFPANAVIIPSF